MGQASTSGNKSCDAPSQRICISHCTNRKPGGTKAIQIERKDLVREYVEKCKDGELLFTYSHETSGTFMNKLKDVEGKYMHITKEEWERRLVVRDKHGVCYKFPFSNTIADDATIFPLKVSLLDTGVRDMSDLTTMHDPSLQEFVMSGPLDEKPQEKDLTISLRGNVLEGSPNTTSIKAVFPPACAVHCLGEDAEYKALLEVGQVSSDMEQKRFIWKGRLAELPEFLYRVIQIGYDDFSLTMYRELVTASFDKNSVVEAKELETSTEVEEWPKSWVITEFVWCVVESYTFTPVDEYIMKLANDVALGLRSKDKAISSIVSRGNSPVELKEFSDLIGDGTFVNHELFVKRKAELAHTRAYSVFYTVGRNLATLKLDGDKTRGNFAEICAAIEQRLCEKTKDMGTWELCLEWEAVKLFHIEEFLHQVKHSQAHERHEAAAEIASRALELVIKRCKNLEKGKVAAKKNTTISEMIGISLQSEDVTLLVQTERDLIDRACKLYETQILSHDRFREQIERHCARMVDFCTHYLIQQAEDSGSEEYAIFALRTRADFMRMLIVHCPTAKHKEEECLRMYNDAIARRNKVDVWCQAVLSCYANAAMFAAECLRNREEAILLCRAGRRHFERRKFGTSMPSNGAYLAWSLLESNRKAIASWIVILIVTFREESLKLHAEQVPDPPPQVCGFSPVAPSEVPAFCGVSCIQVPTSSRDETPRALFEDKSEEEKATAKRQKAIEKWLSTRPLHSVSFKEIDAQRWSNSICAYDERDLADIAEYDKDPTSTQQQSKEIGIAKSEHLVKSDKKTFVLATTILPRNDDDGRLRAEGLGPRSKEGTVGWSEELEKDFMKALQNWPYGENAKNVNWTAPFSVEIKKGSVGKVELEKLIGKHDKVGALSQDGVITAPRFADDPQCHTCSYVFRENLAWCPECRRQKPSHSWKISGVKLSPGDVLIQWGDNGHRLEKLKQISKPDSTMTLWFLPALCVEGCKIFVRGGYADFHQHFRGWSGHGNLTFVPDSPHMTSYVDLAKAIRDERLLARTPKRPAKRLRGLSARREVLSASSRGCR